MLDEPKPLATVPPSSVRSFTMPYVSKTPEEASKRRMPVPLIVTSGPSPVKPMASSTDTLSSAPVLMRIFLTFSRVKEAAASRMPASTWTSPEKPELEPVNWVVPVPACSSRPSFVARLEIEPPNA